MKTISRGRGCASSTRPAGRARLPYQDLDLARRGGAILSREKPEKWRLIRGDSIWSQMLRTDNSRLSTAA